MVNLWYGLVCRPSQASWQDTMAGLLFAGVVGGLAVAEGVSIKLKLKPCRHFSQVCPEPSSVRWRMPSRQHPIAPYLQHIGVIAEMQRYDCGAAHSSAPNDAEPIIAPAKVIEPHLRARIEEWDDGAGFWIYGRGFVTLISIANGASYP
jgi:hypothetical protein